MKLAKEASAVACAGLLSLIPSTGFCGPVVEVAAVRPVTSMSAGSVLQAVNLHLTALGTSVYSPAQLSVGLAQCMLFLRLSGVGLAKLARYGDAFLRALREETGAFS